MLPICQTVVQFKPKCTFGRLLFVLSVSSVLLKKIDYCDCALAKDLSGFCPITADIIIVSERNRIIIVTVAHLQLEVKSAKKIILSPVYVHLCTASVQICGISLRN